VVLCVFKKGLMVFSVRVALIKVRESCVPNP
jgi:hypothetical protein